MENPTRLRARSENAILPAMPFRSGPVSYARFRVVESGDAASSGARSVSTIIETLAGGALRPGAIGEPQPSEFGFCAGRHVFDLDFDPDSNVVGESILFGMRIDTNKVPAEIKRAYRAMAETTYLEDSSTGILSRREKQAAKEDAEERCRQELAEGRYRRSKMVEVLWDRRRNVVLAPLFSDAAVQGLRDLFFNAFDLRLQPLSSGTLAYEILSSQGKLRDYEDLRPSIFGPRPSGTPSLREGSIGTSSLREGPHHAERGGTNDESWEEDDRKDRDRPHVPWAHTSPEASDFIGNEFLMWLWWLTETDAENVSDAFSEILFAIDRQLDMECAWELTGKQTLHASGPGRSPEARTGLRQGKWPRKAGMIVAARGESFEAAFQADRFILSGIKLPRPEEEAKSQREDLEHRLAMLELLDDAMLSAYRAFLGVRASGAWNATRERIAHWIAGRGRHLVEMKPAETEVETLAAVSAAAEPAID